MVPGHNNRTELNDKLFKSIVIKLVHLPSTQQPHINIPYQAAKLRLAREECQAIVLEHSA